ncbi:MAG TPA: hypothetical protein ENH38_09295 [Nitrospirae bacterium]|nr:hypothetical protein [Nitrospirota bacterium]
MMQILAVILLIIVVLAVLLWRGQSRWSQYTSAQSQKVKAAASREANYVNLEEVNELPEPVKRYFHLVLKDGAPIINRAFISQVGGFRAKPEMKRWSKIEAEQYFSSSPRAFVWNSIISIIPGISIRVCDSYIEGKGGMKVKLLSLFTLIDAQNRRELDEGALQRYLAEAVWFPTALLPSQGVTWTALEDHKAKALISDSDITTSLEFEFNEKGEVVSVYTPSRYREVSGKYEPTPWKGRFSRYTKVNDYLIPQEGEVEWHLKDQVYPYWKAGLREIRYD